MNKKKNTVKQLLQFVYIIINFHVCCVCLIAKKIELYKIMEMHFFCATFFLIANKKGSI